MPLVLPVTVRLTPAFARSRASLGELLGRAAGPRARGYEPLWRLSSREWWFARTLLVEHTRLWLWRTDPRARAGDFLVVDMSSPDPSCRRVWVLDLKCRAPVKLGGGGAGISLLHADHAVAELEGAGVIRGLRPILATGDGRALMALYGTR